MIQYNLLGVAPQFLGVVHNCNKALLQCHRSEDLFTFMKFILYFIETLN